MNYLFRCPHEHMTSLQYLTTSRYVSTFSTLFQTQDIKIFWAWNLESLIFRTGSLVTLDRIRCCSVLERQHALGTRMVSWKYLVCFICHSLETKASFFIFYVYVFLLLQIKFYIYSQMINKILFFINAICNKYHFHMWGT